MWGERAQPGLCPALTAPTSRLSVRPSEQSLVLIVISLVSGPPPAGRSKDGMCSFAHFLKNRGTRVHFLKTGAPWIRLSMELNWSGFCAFFLRVHLKFLSLVEQFFSTLITNGEGKSQSRTIWRHKHKPRLWPETSDLYLFSCDQLLG